MKPSGIEPCYASHPPTGVSSGHYVRLRGRSGFAFPSRGALEGAGPRECVRFEPREIKVGGSREIDSDNVTVSRAETDVCARGRSIGPAREVGTCFCREE